MSEGGKVVETAKNSRDAVETARNAVLCFRAVLKCTVPYLYHLLRRRGEGYLCTVLYLYGRMSYSLTRYELNGLPAD